MRAQPGDESSAALRLRLYGAADRRPVHWKNGGGVTYEIARDPAGDTFDGFDWRISMARLVAEGPFSHFAGVQRTLAVVEGAVELRVGSAPACRLDPTSPPISFPGDAAVSARPLDPTLDLNVMTRSARCVAHVEAVERRTMRLTGTDATLTAVVVCLRPGTRIVHESGAIDLGRHDACRMDGHGNAAHVIVDAAGMAYVIRLDRAVA